MKFVKIPAGEFNMGLNDFEPALMEVSEAKARSKDLGPVQHVVASRKPNQFRVYDMSGNVWSGLTTGMPPIRIRKILDLILAVHEKAFQKYIGEILIIALCILYTP
ncbi:MAG: formylglycine-generating enzyme family protein [Gammaproteobacteria bacterium]|nr:formylglycine-generating enzyme family protein [Gammaproteobacteria bacterium]